MTKHTLNAILVDNESGSIDNLSSWILKYCPEIKVVCTATTVAEAYKLILKYDPDVVFLDIQMNDETGFDLLKKFDPIPFEVIFVTAYDLYGIQAVKFSALDYLLKPIDGKELQLAVKKLSDKLDQNSARRLVENLKTQILFPADKSKHKIALPSGNETRLVMPANIIYCKSDNSYTFFYLLDGSTILVCKSIKEYEILLADYGFLRVHQSYLVNKEYIQGYSKKEGMQLILNNGATIPVSKNKKEEVLKQITMQ